MCYPDAAAHLLAQYAREHTVSTKTFRFEWKPWHWSHNLRGDVTGRDELLQPLLDEYTMLRLHGIRVQGAKREDSKQGGIS